MTSTRPTSEPGDPTSARVGVAVVGGRPLARAAACALLTDLDPAIRLVVNLPTAAAVSASAPLTMPDVVLLDGGESSVHRRDTVKAIRRAWTHVSILVLADVADAETVRSWVFAGARGVLTRDASRNALRNAILTVSRGELWIDRRRAAALIRELAQKRAARVPTAEGREPADSCDSLTAREQEIVARVGRGLCPRSIAQELSISEHTVRHHMRSIFGKLGVHSLVSLAAYAIGRR